MWKYLAFFFLSLALWLPAQSQAQGVRDYANRQDGYVGAVYLGLKYGEVTFALDSSDLPEDGSDVMNFGLVFGRKVNDILGWEVEYTYTASEDDVTLEDVFEETRGNTTTSIDFEYSDVSLEKLGFFLIAKSSGNVYAKGRLGYVRNTLELGDLGDDNIYGIAYGFGGGVKIGDSGSNVEFEYTRYPSEEYRFSTTSPFTGRTFSDDKDVYSDMFTIAWVWSFE